MNGKEEIRAVMEQIRRAHAEFAEAWEASKSANFKNSRPYDVAKLTGEELEEMYRANGQAYRDARPQEEKLYSLVGDFFERYLNPLMPAFEKGDSQAVDGVLDFLEVDVPAFKLGYQKEYIYRRLKHLPLNERQAARLRQIAYNLCRGPHYRREISEVGRLMIKLADGPLVRELQKLLESPDEFVRKRARRMLKVILHGRKDLMEGVPAFPLEGDV